MYFSPWLKTTINNIGCHCVRPPVHHASHHCKFNADPNRPGMHMKLIKFLLNLRVPRIVYVSCNPATCARDLDYLCHGVVCVILLYFSSCSLRFIYLSCWRFCAGGTEYKRMLQANRPTASWHVPTHTSYWVCLPSGALLICDRLNLFISRLGTISFSATFGTIGPWMSDEFWVTSVRSNLMRQFFWFWFGKRPINYHNTFTYFFIFSCLMWLPSVITNSLWKWVQSVEFNG